jgi:hypothetical protein
MAKIDLLLVPWISRNLGTGKKECSCSSPNFLHFVGLDRGRHSGLPSSVAKVTPPNPLTESHGAKTFGDSKIARLPPGMCRGPAITTWVLVGIVRLIEKLLNACASMSLNSC